MAKKTSKQGKKAKKNTGKRVNGQAQKSPVIETKATESSKEMPVKAVEKTSERAPEKKPTKSVEKEPEKKPEKDAKQQKAQLKAQQKPQQKKAQQKSAKSSKQGPKKDGVLKKVLAYFKNVRLEIKRTTWPSRNEVLRMSLIVVGALLFFGVFIFAIDWVMTQLLNIYASLVPTDTSSTTALDFSLACFLNLK